MARTDPRPHYGEHRPSLAGGGYVRIYRPDHPLAMKDGYVLEHRMVMWDAGLLVDRSLEVHHRNGDREDNRLENLEVTRSGEHQSAHAHERGTITNQWGTFGMHTPEGRIEAVRRRGRRNARLRSRGFRYNAQRHQWVHQQTGEIYQGAEI